MQKITKEGKSMTNNYFSKNLKSLRQFKGLSLQQLANKVNVSKAHIWQLEKSNIDSNPSLKLLKEISSYFRITISQLIEEPFADSTYHHKIATRLSRYLKNFSSEDLELTEDFIKMLSSRKSTHC